MAPLAPTKIRSKKQKIEKQKVFFDAQPESSAAGKPSPAIVPSMSPISATKPSKEKKPAQTNLELQTPTSISRPRRLRSSSAVTLAGKKTKKPVPEPELSSPDEDEDKGQDEDEDEDEDGHLHGFSTDDDDSSDGENAMDDEPSAFDVSKLPTIAKDDATVKHKLEKAKRQPTEDCGVLFIGRLPHGFYEDQLKAYFSQFGNVTRLRISRNKKTGKSKHYGFIEFDSSSVAQIVADTMDNYLIMGHILRCKLIPKGQVHPELWIGANRKWRAVPRDRLTRVEHNKPRTDSEQMRANKRLLKRQNERKRKLEQAGIKYDFEAVSYKKANLVESD